MVEYLPSTLIDRVLELRFTAKRLGLRVSEIEMPALEWFQYRSQFHQMLNSLDGSLYPEICGIRVKLTEDAKGGNSVPDIQSA